MTKLARFNATPCAPLAILAIKLRRNPQNITVNTPQQNNPSIKPNVLEPYAIMSKPACTSRLKSALCLSQYNHSLTVFLAIFTIHTHIPNTTTAKPCTPSWQNSGKTALNHTGLCPRPRKTIDSKTRWNGFHIEYKQTTTPRFAPIQIRWAKV